MSSIPAITWSIICKRRRHFPLLSRFHQAHYFPYPFTNVYTRAHHAQMTRNVRIHAMQRGFYLLQTHYSSFCDTFIQWFPAKISAIFSHTERRTIIDFLAYRSSLLSLFPFFFFFFLIFARTIRAYNHAFPTIYTFSFAILRAPFFLSRLKPSPIRYIFILRIDRNERSDVEVMPRYERSRTSSQANSSQNEDNEARTLSWILSFMVGFFFSARFTFRIFTRGLIVIPWKRMFFIAADVSTWRVQLVIAIDKK